MYQPPAFRADDPALLLEVMRTFPFATLVTTREGEPYASLLPLLIDDGALVGHMARANPHWRVLPDGPVLAIFHGPHAYVSPRWYVEPAAHVPTWNYVTVHAYGHAELLDTAGTLDALERLVVQEEARFDPPWRPDPEVLRALVPGVVGFRIRLTRVEGKLKLSQNRAPADAQGVVEGLERGSREEVAVVAWMRRVRGG